MDSDPASSLQRDFGFSTFRPGQAEAIQSLKNNRHTLVVMPTGAGKSLIYQLVALSLPGLTLVISPLIALMKDQVDALARRQIPAAFINSTLSTGEQSRRLREMEAGKYRLVYVAPERLRSAPFQGALKNRQVSLLAVDEAHCISEWGHDFRPDYLHIARFRTALMDPLTAALTATATPQVQEDIIRLLGLSNARRIVTGFNRPNLAFEVQYAPNLPARLKALQQILSKDGKGGVIVYTGTRRDAEEVAEFICTGLSVPAEYYHAGLPTEERARVQEAFVSGRLPVVVATNAFGMGIDRPDVRQVIHYSIPGSLEAYYQEAGRAGRDGQPAWAVLLYSPEDRALQEWFIDNSAVTIPDLRMIFDAVQTSSSPHQTVTVNDLSRRLGMPEIKVKVGLAQLEGAGILEHPDDDGLRMRLRALSWDLERIRTVADKLKRHQDHRKGKLMEMIAYAESNQCRRAILLEHFGDPGPAEVDVCCDNCQTVRPVHPALAVHPGGTEAGQIAIILLDAVGWLKRGLGREKVGRILKGSLSQDLFRFGYDRSPYYGKLNAFSLKRIIALLDQLLEMGYLKVIGGKYPVLRLTPKGQKAAQERESISLQLPFRVGDKSMEGKRPVSSADSDASKPGQENLNHIVELGNSKSASSLPELIRELNSLNGNARRLAASALGKIGNPIAVIPLMELLQCEEQPQVRQYAVKALGQIGDASAVDLLDCIANDSLEKYYTRGSAKVALQRIFARKAAEEKPTDPVEAFLSRDHPRPLSGPWDEGWALGFHSRFSGEQWERSETGELAYRLKYQGDLSVLPSIVEKAASLLSAHPQLAQVDAIVPVPPSTPREQDPVCCFAQALSQRLDIPSCQALVKSRQTQPQKEMHSLAQKQANVCGAFKPAFPVRVLRLLVVDDLFDSGATMEEITRVLKRSGASRVFILTLTRTIHTSM